jgi:uncharacterized Tic20 family protein
MITQQEKNNAALIHLGGLAKYVFPFAGIIVPLLIWQSKRHESEFIDKQGKEAVNFNISMLVYTLIISLLFIVPFILLISDAIMLDDAFNDHPPVNFIISLIVVGIIFVVESIFEFILIIFASVRASEGQNFKYPLTIKFIK